MAAKGTYCEMCSKRGKKADLIFRNGHYFCTDGCADWYHEIYEGDEVKCDDN